MLKAYSTCVGAGPFVAENAVSEKWQQDLREAGGEFGAQQAVLAVLVLLMQLQADTDSDASMQTKSH